MKAFFLTLLLGLASCTKYAEIKQESVGVEVSPVQMEVYQLDEIDWAVGMHRESKVSQSFAFVVALPKLRDDDLQFLIKEKNIDSWILRLIVTRGSGSQDLGSLHALLQPQKHGRGQQSGAPTSVTFKVFYAAAFASERFRAFKCPAHGHDKRISDMSVSGSNDEFSIPLSGMKSYGEKSHHIELTPSAFNGGHSLVGTYHVEIAAYDSKRKEIHSNFIRIPMSVNVASEETVKISSCGGVHPEIQ